MRFKVQAVVLLDLKQDNSRSLFEYAHPNESQKDGGQSLIGPR